MPAGAYRHRVLLENPGEPQPDGDGGYTEGWSPLDPSIVDVSIQAASTRDLERVTGGTVVATASHLIRMRFHPGVNTETRITFRGRHFAVDSVQNVEERDVALIVICTEIKDASPLDVAAAEAPTGGPTPPPSWT